MADIIFSSTVYSKPTAPMSFVISSPLSGSTASNGLCIYNDTNPSGSTLTVSGSLIDEDYETPITMPFTSNYSIGIDLGTSGSIYKINIYDDGTAGIGLSQSGSHDAGRLFTSPDNINWTKERTYTSLTRELYSGSTYRTSFKVSPAITARMFKVYAYRGSFQSMVGNNLQLTEIRAFEQPSNITHSGSLFRPHSITVTPKSHPNGTIGLPGRMTVPFGDVPGPGGFGV